MQLTIQPQIFKPVNPRSNIEPTNIAYTRKNRNKISFKANDGELAGISKHRGFGKIAGYDNEKNILMKREGQALLLEHKMRRHDLSMDISNGILLYGPHGCGKKTFARAFAEETNCRFDKFDNFLPDSERGRWNYIRNKIQLAQRHFTMTRQRTILLADDIQELTRGDNLRYAMKGLVDDLSAKYHVTIFATTSCPEDVEEGILWTGRFNTRLGLPPANKQNTLAILKHYLQQVADKSVNYDELTEEIAKSQPDAAFSNARIKAIRNKAWLNSDRMNWPNLQSNLLKYIKNLGPDITKESMELFAKQMEYIRYLH